MKTLSSLWFGLVALGPFLALAQCCAQGTFTWVTFDGPPLIPLGTGKVVQEYYESGVSFTPIDPTAPFAGFVRNGGGGGRPLKTALPICRLPWQAVSCSLR